MQKKRKRRKNEENSEFSQRFNSFGLSFLICQWYETFEHYKMPQHRFVCEAAVAAQEPVAEHSKCFLLPALWCIQFNKMYFSILSAAIVILNFIFLAWLLTFSLYLLWSCSHRSLHTAKCALCNGCCRWHSIPKVLFLSLSFSQWFDISSLSFGFSFTHAYKIFIDLISPRSNSLMFLLLPSVGIVEQFCRYYGLIFSNGSKWILCFFLLSSVSCCYQLTLYCVSVFSRHTLRRWCVPLSTQ